MSGDEERNLQLLLRNIAGVVMLVLVGFIVVMIIVVPVFAPHVDQDTTLLLGLLGSLLGAMLVLFGLQASIIRGNGK